MLKHGNLDSVVGEVGVVAIKSEEDRLYKITYNGDEDCDEPGFKVEVLHPS